MTDPPPRFVDRIWIYFGRNWLIWINPCSICENYSKNSSNGGYYPRNDASRSRVFLGESEFYQLVSKRAPFRFVVGTIPASGIGVRSRNQQTRDEARYADARIGHMRMICIRSADFTRSVVFPCWTGSGSLFG